MKTFSTLLLFISLMPLFCSRATGDDAAPVVVNGVPIPESLVLKETDMRIDAQAAKQNVRGLVYDESSRGSTRAFMRDDILHMLIERQLISDQLKADKLEINAADIDARFLKQVRQRNQTIEQAEQEMKENGETVAGVKEGYRQTMGVERLFAAHATDQKAMTSDEAREFYNGSLAYFSEPEKRRVSRILIRVEPHATAAIKDAARARSEALLKRIAAGEEFTAVASACSEDQASARHGGDRGWSPRGWVNSPDADRFGTAAFAINKVGDITGVVETQDGYDIIKLTGISPARTKPFEEVETQIIQDARYRKIGSFWQNYGNQLWKIGKIEWSVNEIARQTKKHKDEMDYQRQMDQLHAAK